MILISVVDTDPVGSETLAGSGFGKNNSGSGQLRILNEFEIKIGKTDNFSTKKFSLEI
jgi:hypothetical protein